MKTLWLIVAGLVIAATGAVAFDAAAPQATTIVVKPGQELRITVEVVGTATTPPDDPPPPPPPPVDPPPVDPPPTPPTDPPKPPKAPLVLTVPTDGTLAECAKRIAANGKITIEPGVHRTKSVEINTAGVMVQGKPGSVLSPAADYGEGALIVVNQPGCRLESLTIDMEFLNRRKAIRGEKRAGQLLVIGCEIRNVAWHACDIDGADCAIENCKIHHCLWLNPETGRRDDAHGVVTLASQRLKIRGCRIWNCSGDCVQGDRGRWQDLLIEDCDLYWEPLAADMGGFLAGEMCGEDAFDSKTSSAEWQRATIRNCRIWGFAGDKRRLKSVECINAKEHCDLLVEGCEISGVVAVRLALYRDGKQLRATIRNCKIHDSVVAFRVEDQKQGTAAQPPSPSPITIEGCDVAVADRPSEPEHKNGSHFYFVGLNASDTFGKTGFGPGASVTATTFRGNAICIQRGDVPAITAWLTAPEFGNTVLAP